jgi:HSP20 family molecular chaperone IbpA
MANTIQKKETQTDVSRPETTQSVFYTPRVDIVENDDELTLFADVPGVKSDDTDIRFENGELVIHARCSPRQGETNYWLAEYGIGDFYRAFTINENVDSAKISAELKNGVLTVHLPKTEAVKPKKIQVKGS